MKFSGIVKKHMGRGTILGFPTANIDPPPGSEDGIYAGWTRVKSQAGQGQKLPSVIFIGSNPTFNESYKRAEAYLLDYSGDLYDQEIEIETLKKIREVIRFDSPEKLVEQMKKDEQIAREFFAIIMKGR